MLSGPLLSGDILKAAEQQLFVEDGSHQEREYAPQVMIPDQRGTPEAAAATHRP